MLQAVATAQVPVAAAEGRGLRRYLTVMLFGCLVLQRFGVPVGEPKLSVSVPIVGLATAAALAGGLFVFDRRRTALVLALTAVAVLSLAVSVHMPLSIAPRQSVASLGQFVLLTGFAALTFARVVPERAVFGPFVDAFCLIALAGMAQFFAQFAGLSLFKFDGIVPSSFLVESIFALELPIGSSGYNRSNGFFLVEPSVTSQIMALGLMIEMVWRRRLLRLAILGGGLVCTVSGTGLMVLGAFLLTLLLGAGLRGVRLVAGLGVAAVLLLGVLTVLAPDVVESFAERSTEVVRPGSSGHERFVTPWWAVAEALEASLRLLVLGLGPGTAEYLNVTWSFWTNTPSKLLIDYGVPGLLLYLALFFGVPRTPRQRLILPGALMLLMLTGGYHQFAPVLLPMLLLLVVARLEPDEAA